MHNKAVKKKPEQTSLNTRPITLNLRYRIPFTLKMVLLTIMISLVVWIILDYMQTSRLRSIFHSQLTQKLAKQAMEDRLSFDRYVKTFQESVKLFVTQKDFIDYIKSPDRFTEDTFRIIYHRQSPTWFPGRSVLRTFVQPRYALLLDSRGGTREVYLSQKDAPPPSLLKPADLLVRKSHGQSFMTFMNDVPYVVTAESLLNSQGKSQATLLLASPIDDEFLNASLGPSQEGHLVSLMSSEENSRILTSNDLEKLPVGSTLNSLQKNYIVTGNEFFDYGASELQIKFVSFVSLAEVGLLTSSVISRARQEHAVMAIIFILAFVLIMFSITRRIERLTERVEKFSENSTGRQKKQFRHTDQIYILEERFQDLMKNVEERTGDLIKEIEERKRAEEELKRHRNHLEELVNERTVDLRKTNEELEEEIAERIRTENSLRLSEEKFSKAFRSSPTLMSISTLQEGRFIDVNDAFLKASGYNREEIIGQTSLELNIWDVPVERSKMIDQLLNKGVVYNQEIGMRIKTGEILTVLLFAEMIDMEGKPCILAVELDITDRKKLESQLLHAQKMESIGTLAGGVAHDFNNILTAILGFGNLMKMKMKEDDPLRPNVDYILSAAEKATCLTQSLLTFSRKQKINPIPINMNKIIRKLEKFLLRIIGEDIEFITKFAEKGLNVMADINEMEQVLMNLITNARDAMPRGGLLTLQTESVKIDDEFVQLYGYGKPGMYAVILISDTGMGMDKKTKEKIFEPFFTTKEVNKGTGLGLSIIYGIIKQHNGYINVYSEPGIGTTFKIYLPMIKQTVKIPSKKQADVSVHPTGTETILVAEDDALIRKFITSVLTEFGYRVIAAEDGEDAINKFVDNKDSIQFVISDVIMPKKSGRELYEKIRSIKPDIKTLFLSGYSKELIHQKDLLEEGIEIIPKPVKPDELLKKIRKALDVNL